MRYLIHTLFLSMCSVSAAVAADAVLINETFTDGDLTGGADSQDATWFAASAATATVIDDTAGLGAGNALQIVSTGNFARVTAAFDAPATLSSAGDKLTIELQMRMTRANADNNGGIRFGLHHDNGAPVTAENLDTGWTALTQTWDGYYFRGGVGASPGMRIYQDVPTQGNSAVGGSGDITIGNGTGWALDDNANHTVRIEIERTANQQNILRFFFDGENMQEITTATVGGAPSAFTNFTIGGGSLEIDLVVDNVVVTLSEGSVEPPEPIDLATRLVDWTRAGLPGEIPVYAAIINFVEAGGDPSGKTDNTPLLQSIIDDLQEDTVIFFPAGLYRFNRRIDIHDTPQRDLPGVVIRGAGTRDTKLLFMDSVSEDSGLFDVGGYAASADVAITGGLTKGSTQITLQSADGIFAGDWLVIRQDNDPVAMATTRSISDYADTIDNSTGWAARVVGQIVQVQSVAGNTVSLDRPLHLDFTWPNPTATVSRMITGIGFEDFTLENGLASAGRINIDFQRAANCWISNIHSLMAMRFHVGTELCANLLVRDSYFNDAWRHDGGGHGYGVLLADTTTHCLVENNVFRNLRHAMIWKEGANGNVFAYNYSTDGQQDGAAVAKDISGHGHYAFANLIEGNIAQFIHASDFWGPVGPNNTFLRNRTTEERILIEDNSRDQNIIGNELISPTAPFVVVDGTSTGAYVHGNNEGGALQWRAGEQQVVPPSYLYTTAPEFWTIPAPWPSIGPEFAAGQHTIPAKYRWDNGLMEMFIPPVPEIEVQPLSAAADAGGGVTFSVEVTVHGKAAYQWKKDGVALGDGGRVTGANTPTLTIAGITPEDAGSYTLVITNERGSTSSAVAILSVWDADDGRLVNLSTRGEVRTGNDILIAGFVVAGDAPKSLLVRGIGPSLEEFVGPGRALEDSMLSVFSGGVEILNNDDWGTAEDFETVRSTNEAVGGFVLDPAARDAVLLADFSAGAYSVHLNGKSGSGLGLVELYDADTAGNSRLMNISTRGRVGSGDSIMVPGIVVEGNPRRLLIRGVGPELAASFGFAPEVVLPDPVLTLKDASGATVVTNDNWGEGNDVATVAAVSDQVGAFALTPGGLDAVLLVEVPPGLYTALVEDATGGEGIAIVEVYAAP